MAGWAASKAFPRKVALEIIARDPICRCLACKWHTSRCTKRSVEADHIIAAADGGTDTPDNGQGLCKSCHAQKTAHHANATRWRNTTRRPAERHPGLT